MRDIIVDSKGRIIILTDTKNNEVAPKIIILENNIVNDTSNNDGSAPELTGGFEANLLELMATDLLSLLCIFADKRNQREQWPTSPVLHAGFTRWQFPFGS